MTLVLHAVPSRAPAMFAILAGVLFSICCWLFLSHLGIQEFMTNSDQLTIPSFFDDITRNAYFTIRTWSLPRASIIVPDVAAYAVVFAAVKDSFITIYILASLQIACVVVILKLFLDRIAQTRTEAMQTLCLFLLLVISGLLLAKSHISWNIPFWFLIPLSHAGSAIVALAFFLWFEKNYLRAPFYLAVTSGLISVPLIISDRLFVTYFTIPYLLVTVLRSLKARNYRWLIIFVASQMIAAFLAIFVTQLMNAQAIETLQFNPLMQLRAVYQTIAAEGKGGWLYFLGGIGLLLGVAIPLGLSLLRSHETKMSDRDSSLLFLVVVSACNLAVTFLLWTQPTFALTRYGVGYQLGFFIFGALLLRNVIDKTPIGLARAVGISSAVLLFMAFAKTDTSSFLQPFRNRTLLQNTFAECSAKYQLKDGLANYWLARKLTVSLLWKNQIDQTEPGSPMPFFWGNNSAWFYLAVESGKRAIRNFIITNGLAHSDVERFYGKPSNEVDCGEYHLWVYNNVDTIQNAVSNLLFSKSAELGTNWFLPASAKSFIGLQTELSINVVNLPRQVGSDDGVSVQSGDHAGLLSYGPYLSLSAGSYIAYVDLICTTGETGNYVDVRGGSGAVLFAKDNVNCTGERQRMSLPFNFSQPMNNIEIRTYFGGKNTMTLLKMSVEPVN